jgi:hypothetical protein
MFDPTTITSGESATYEVTNPSTGEATGWLIEFAGPPHAKTLAVKRAALSRAFKSQRTNKEPTYEELDEQSVDGIVKRIIGWSGSTIEFSEDSAKSLLLNPKHDWLKAQLNDFLNAQASFIKRSATTS